MTTILLSQNIPPSRTGSAHIIKELLSNTTDEDHLLVLGGNSPFALPAAAPRVLTFPSELSFSGRGARLLRPIRAILFPFLVVWVRFWIQRRRARKVVCVFPDGFYCLAAYVAVSGTNVALEYWFHNSYAPNRRYLLGLIARWLEPRMIRRAEKIHCLSDALGKLYADAYPASAHKISITRHPAGEPLPALSQVNRQAKFFSCLLIGNINESNRDATSRLFEAIRHLSNTRILLATQVPRKLLLLRGVSLKNIDYLGYLSDAELEAAAQRADVLLLPHGLRGAYAIEEYATIFPTRATYYFRMGKPIFSLCPENSFLSRFLSTHNCAKVCTSPNIADIRADFLALLENASLRSSIAENALLTAKLFSSRHVIEQLTR